MAVLEKGRTLFMDRKAFSGITVLIMLLTCMLTLASNIQPVKTELVERKVGVNTGDWAEYKNYTFSWESNVPYDELGNETKSFIKNHENLYSLKITVLEVSDTLVNYEVCLRFKNGTEQATQTFVIIETGSGSNMWLIAANLSAGDSIYTHYSDWVITETFQSVYLGESREINLLLGKTTSYTSGPYTVSLNFTIVWDRFTGILLEWHGILNATENTKTVTYRFNFKITGTNRWGYKIWTVDDDGPADFHIIQEAINTASLGDTIFVKSGVYYENIVINKLNLTLIGENKETTIIDGYGFGSVVDVRSDNVTITDLTLINSSSISPCSGVILNGVRNCIISENEIVNNGGDGIYIICSSNNYILENNIVRNDVDGIALASSLENKIFKNNIAANGWDGIFIGANSVNNTVYSNNVFENVEGICTVYALNNKIFHNNFINNTYQVSSYESLTVWNDRYPSGGNYWSDYNGTDEYRGPIQNETGSDGIGDTPYIIDENNTDRYPLMNLWLRVSGRLAILEPANGLVITGPAKITFTIENTGDDVKFLQGDSSNRIDLEIEYESADGNYGWGIVLWSTSYYGLTLHSGEKYEQTIVYDPLKYEGSAPPNFIGETPYGGATIRLVHWKSDGGYNIGEFGKVEVQVTFLPPTATAATINLNPHTLNLRSRGKWITAYIELPEDNVADINVSSIMLNDTIPVEPKPIAIGYHDNDSIPDLMVKFERAEVIQYIMDNIHLTKLYEERFMTITLTVTGYLNDGTPFQGSTTIRIIMPMPRGIGRHIFPI